MIFKLKCFKCKKENEITISPANEFKCVYCKAVILEKVLDGGKSFGEKTNDYTVNLSNEYTADIVKQKIIEKKISDCERGMSVRNFTILDGTCPDTVYVMRLRVLNQFHAKDENELRLVNKKLKGDNYEKFLKACDEQTKALYIDIERQVDENILAEEEIKKVDGLLNVNLFDDALSYAKQMVEKHPRKALAWIRLLYAKQKRYLNIYYNAELKGNKLGGAAVFDVIKIKHKNELFNDFEAMLACPDFNVNYYNLDKQRTTEFYACNDTIIKSVVLQYDLMMSEKALDGYAVTYVKEEEKRLKKEQKEREKLARK